MNIRAENFSPEDWEYLSAVVGHGQMPDLAGMWALMDKAWKELGCSQDVMDSRISRFYAHPVWLLNGLFIEQHAESITHRTKFTEYVASCSPKRVADFGGGYGSLARMIGIRCPDAQVHVVEPHPSANAVALAEKTPNVRYVANLQGEYDVLVATDVFEHVPDPLALLASTASHLREHGQYLIANCFWPVILCHLPSTFHFRWSWDAALSAMNLQPGMTVAYGRSYQKVGPVMANPARAIEARSKRWFGLINRMPHLLQAPTARRLFQSEA